jgi:hypothetical protein
MQSINTRGLDELSQRFEKLLRESDDLRREFHEEAAQVLKREISRSIDSSGLQDGRGRIKGWQESRIGSRGGYAAISAEKGETGPNSPGAITNYLENGHRIRRPSGRAKRYKPRNRVIYVNGFHFYAGAVRSVQAQLVGRAEELARKIGDTLEGKQ